MKLVSALLIGFIGLGFSAPALAENHTSVTELQKGLSNCPALGGFEVRSSGTQNGVTVSFANGQAAFSSTSVNRIKVAVYNQNGTVYETHCSTWYNISLRVTVPAGGYVKIWKG